MNLNSKRAKILVVEDDPVSRSLLAQMLTTFGDVDSAEDGSRAIAMLSEAFTSGRNYDLVCLDVMMPNIDGFGVLAELRQLEGKGLDSELATRVVMITALIDQESFVKAHEGGSLWYITKPISREEVFGVLHDLGFESVA